MINAALFAHFTQLIQSDHIVTGDPLSPVPEASLPLIDSDDGTWQYRVPDSAGEPPEAPQVPGDRPGDARCARGPGGRR